MRTGQLRRVSSALMIAGGVALVGWGVRDLFDASAGQDEARREFESERPSPWGSAAKPAQIRRGDQVAKISFPRLDAALYVVEGDGERELRMGPGHLKGSAMPGQKGNCVIAGHRDTHFRLLKDIRHGDEIVLETHTGQFRYRVENTKIVSPADTASLQPTTSAELNLITCYPFYYVGPAPKRFIVRARLVPDRTVTASIRGR